MNKFESAAQAWAVLAWAARHRQTMTYEQLGQTIKVIPVRLGQVLDPIQAYCVAQKLPPLTVLVVQKDTGLPGPGFTAAQAVQVATDQSKVFEYDWLKHGNPQVAGLKNEATPITDDSLLS